MVSKEAERVLGEWRGKIESESHCPTGAVLPVDLAEYWGKAWRQVCRNEKISVVDRAYFILYWADFFGMTGISGKRLSWAADILGAYQLGWDKCMEARGISRTA